MAMTKEQILTEAMALEPRERDEVAETLWQCAVPGEFSAEQLAEIRQRVDDLDRGRVQPIGGDEVMQELRQRFQR
jgi:putative addiction module component (TIGR02574 family)